MPDDSVFCVATRTRSVSPLTIGSFKDIRVHGVASDYSTKRLAYRNPTSDSDQMQGTTCGLYPNDLSRGQRVARGRSLVVALPCQKKFWPAVSAARRETLFAAAATNGMAPICMNPTTAKKSRIYRFPRSRQDPGMQLSRRYVLYTGPPLTTTRYIERR